MDRKNLINIKTIYYRLIIKLKIEFYFCIIESYFYKSVKDKYTLWP